MRIMKKLLFVTLLFSTIQSNLKGQDLLLYYPFSGNTIDESQNENHGIIYGATLTNDYNGNPLSAYLFNGADSYITAGDSESMRIDTAVTIMANIKATGNGSINSGGIIVNKEGEYSFARFADGSLRYALGNDMGWGSHVNTGITIPLNEQKHVALTYSETTGVINIYIDYELLYSNDISWELGDADISNNELRIGGRQALAQFFEGVIDEVKVYGRALSSAEILNENPSGITDNLQNHLIELYPNPAIETLLIRANGMDINEIKIFDLSGKLLINEVGFEIGSIDISHLKSGNYIVHFFNKNNSLIAIKEVTKIK